LLRYCTFYKLILSKPVWLTPRVRVFRLMFVFLPIHF
jgi:hypothetical protein